MFKGKINKLNERVQVIFLILTSAVLLFYTVEGITGNYNKCISEAVTTADTRNCIAAEY